MCSRAYSLPFKLSSSENLQREPCNEICQELNVLIFFSNPVLKFNLKNVLPGVFKTRQLEIKFSFRNNWTVSWPRLLNKCYKYDVIQQWLNWNYFVYVQCAWRNDLGNFFFSDWSWLINLAGFFYLKDLATIKFSDFLGFYI